MPKYYIWASDPHGTGQPWIDLVKEAQEKYPDNKTIFGGDYIDGNKFSLETVKFVYDQVKFHQAVALAGNHEQLIYEFVEHNNDLWYINGAKSTIKSFFRRGYSKKVTQEKLRSNPYYIFLINLPLVIETSKLIFVHAGITPKTNVNHQRRLNDKTYATYFNLWARDEYFYNDVKNKVFAHNLTGKTIVSGHTPTGLISGKYDNSQAGFDVTYTNEQNDFACPIRKIQYPNEPARYLTDNGCHGIRSHHGNVCVFEKQTAKLVDVLNNN